MSTGSRVRWFVRARLTLAGGLVGVSFMLAVIAVVWLAGGFCSVGFRDVGGAQLLTDFQMQHVRGGFLEPKFRLGWKCPPPGGGSGGGSSGGKGPENHSPSLDPATADVSDHVWLMSVGAPETGLSLSLTYNSDVADGTNTVLATVMGAGWTHSFNSFLLQHAGGSFIWMRGNNDIIRFTYRFGHYSSSPGTFAQFTFIAPDRAEIRLKDGSIYRFQQRNVPWGADGAVYTLESMIDPNNRATAMEYDARGLLTRVTGPFGSTIQFVEYTSDNRLARVIAYGRDAALEYDSPTRQLSAIVLPSGARIEYQYNVRCQMTGKRVPTGGLYRVEYSANGKGYRLLDPVGAVILSQVSTTNWDVDRLQSEAAGEMLYPPQTVTVTDGRGNPWEYECDARARVVATHDPDGNITTVEYDAATLLPSRITDANGHVTAYQYDAEGNRTLVRDAEGNETRLAYEPVHNRLVQQTEPDGDVWQYRYDANGNLLEMIDPLVEVPIDATVKYEYHPNFLLWKRTDRNSNVTEWQYCPDGNVSMVIDAACGETAFTYDAFGNVLTCTIHNDDPGTPKNEDQTGTYTYDARDRILTRTDPLGITTRHEYNADGNRTAVYTCWIDDSQYRSVARHEYDGRGRVRRIIEDEGGLRRTTQYEYDGNDNLTRETDPNGVVTEDYYSAENRLQRVVLDPSGLDIESQYVYDAVGNKIRETDPNSHTTTYEYDSLDRRRFVTDPLGNRTEWRYFAAGGGGGGGCACGTPGSGLIHCVIDAEGKVTQYEYDKLDRLTRETRRVGTQDCDVGEDADDVVTAYAYDPNGNRVTATDPDGNVITYTYTARGEVATISNACGETILYVYDLAGNVIEESRPNGNVIRLVYDLNNRVVRISDTLGDLVAYTYDGVGNRLSATDALGHGTLYSYDKLDRRIAVTDSTGDSMRYDYDPDGNETKVTDREENETVHEYDAAGRRTASRIWPQRGGASAITTYGYDRAGNVIRLTDARGNTTVYEYDAADRRTGETYADGTRPCFTYDRVGAIATRQDNMGENNLPGNITRYTHDDLHRLVCRQYADGSADIFAYDKAGRMLSADNAHSHVGFTYDCAGRVLTTTQTDVPQTHSYTITYAYDAVANTRTLMYPGGKVVVETRDFRYRLAEVGGAATYSYDLANRVLAKTLANGTQARYTYNDNDWTTALRHVAPDGTTTFAGSAHDYDREGNRLNARNLLVYNAAKPVTHSEKYGYDDLYRLTDYKRGEWVGADVSAPRRHRTWQLDSVHNWEQFSISDMDTDPNGTYCNAVNQMNEYGDASTDGLPPVPDDDGLPDDFMVEPCLLGAAGGPASADFDGDGDVDLADFASFRTCFNGPNHPAAGSACDRVDLDGDGDVDLADFALFRAAFNGPNRPAFNSGKPLASPGSGYNQAHDKNGNLVDDGQREYYYDYQTTMSSPLRTANRLTMVRDKATGTILGQYWYDALGRRIRRVANGVSTVYVITPGWREIEEYEDGAPARSYTFGASVDEILGMDCNDSGASYYYHADDLGSITAVTDSSGAVVERYGYDPYGTPSFFDASGLPISGSSIGNAALFTGRRYDAETGLYQYRTRYLNPVAGRFTTRDTIGAWGDPMALGNAYAYAGNNPSTYADAYGLGPGDGKKDKVKDDDDEKRKEPTRAERLKELKEKEQELRREIDHNNWAEHSLAELLTKVADKEEYRKTVLSFSQSLLTASQELLGGDVKEESQKAAKEASREAVRFYKIIKAERLATSSATLVDLAASAEGVGQGTAAEAQIVKNMQAIAQGSTKLGSAEARSAAWGRFRQAGGVAALRQLGLTTALAYGAGVYKEELNSEKDPDMIRLRGYHAQVSAAWRGYHQTTTFLLTLLQENLDDQRKLTACGCQDQPDPKPTPVPTSGSQAP